jgi:hypothetical protein
MATLSGLLYDATGLTPLDGATVAAYTIASQPTPPLTNLDGSAVPPVGQPVASTTTSTIGFYSLSGLTTGDAYHLYIVPGDGSAAYWLLYQVPSILATASPCVLYGAIITPDGLPDPQLVQAFLEHPAVITGGLSVTTDPVVVAAYGGTFVLALWPTASLSPQALYRVQVGGALWRGSIPSQASIALDAWTALSTTTRLA